MVDKQTFNRNSDLKPYDCLEIDRDFSIKLCNKDGYAAIEHCDKCHITMYLKWIFSISYLNKIFC